MNGSYPCSVVLAAHGSLVDSSCNQPLFEMADRIATTGIFSMVTPAFLNGEPHLTNVFDLLPPGDIVVVPVMTSEGYYSKTILPGELARNKQVENFRIFLTPALGVAPQIAKLVCDRAITIMTLCQLQPTETSLVLIGHGTSRDPDSGTSTKLLAAQLREQMPKMPIEVAFLDQQPTIDQIVNQINTPHTLVVPFLISRGPHATVDIPAAFGLPTGPEIEFPLVGKSEGGITICDLPIGMYDEMAEVCLDLAVDQLLGGTPIEPNGLIHGGRPNDS